MEIVEVVVVLVRIGQFIFVIPVVVAMKIAHPAMEQVIVADVTELAKPVMKIMVVVGTVQKTRTRLK